MTFLVDVNLPDFFWKLKPHEFIFVSDINRELSDTEIWELALQKKYIILTRDMDFYYKARQSINFPQIIIFRFRNMKLNAIHQYFDQYWNSISELI
jgi:predicted nuclease of predicted toxin-antitoxin system